MRQTKLAGLACEAVLSRIEVGVSAPAWRKRKFADSSGVLMGIFGSKSREGKHQNQKNGDELLPFLIKRIFGEVFFHLF